MTRHRERSQPDHDHRPLEPWENARLEAIQAGFFNEDGSVTDQGRRALKRSGWDETQVMQLEVLQQNALAGVDIRFDAQTREKRLDHNLRDLETQIALIEQRRGTPQQQPSDTHRLSLLRSDRDHYMQQWQNERKAS